MLDMEKILLHNGIAVADSTHKHSRHGWLNVRCPFCTGSDGMHLGWNINQQYWMCWRCDWHPVDQVLAALITNQATIKEILQDYKVARVQIKKQDKVATATKCTMPWNIGKLDRNARNYLRKRNFNPTKLQHLWGLCSTHPQTTIPSMRNRLIAPIYSKGKLVSFQTRDITGKADLRYITASKEEEVIHHKHLLYGMDQVPTDSVVVVEGITDVWRLGFGAVCTFGIKFTPYQVLAIAKFANRFILFDTKDPQAKKQGRSLANQLSTFDGNTEYIELPGKYGELDPAQLSQSFANDLMAELK